MVFGLGGATLSSYVRLQGTTNLISCFAFPSDLDTDQLKGLLDEFSHAVSFIGRQHVIIRPKMERCLNISRISRGTVL